MTILLLSTALAKSWCADPVVAHEWGVAVLTADASAPQVPALPDHFHRPGDPFAVASEPVRTLPPDSGVRTLPVVHFYAPSPYRTNVPLGVEVGFRDGEASVWYPSVDRLVPAALANSPEAAAGRAELLRIRADRPPFGRVNERPDPGADLSRQLHWSSLLLTPAGANPPVPSEVDWVQNARALEGALWVNQGPESERFLFYEADTIETPAVTIAMEGERMVLTNTSEFPVHDVVVVDNGRQAYVVAIAPGATVRTSTDTSLIGLKAQLSKRWSAPDAPLTRDWAGEDCVMMRDPAVPVEQATDHRLYPAELELLWGVWEERLLGDQPHLMYREDPAALDSAMPVSLYTDMQHHIAWSRLGLVLVEGL